MERSVVADAGAHVFFELELVWLLKRRKSWEIITNASMALEFHVLGNLTPAHSELGILEKMERRKGIEEHRPPIPGAASAPLQNQNPQIPTRGPWRRIPALDIFGRSFSSNAPKRSSKLLKPRTSTKEEPQVKSTTTLGKPPLKADFRSGPTPVKRTRDGG